MPPYWKLIKKISKILVIKNKETFLNLMKNFKNLFDFSKDMGNFLQSI